MSYDRPTTAIAEYVASVTTRDVPDEAIAPIVDHHLDAIACALGGFEEEPSEIARKIATKAEPPQGCSVFGLKDKATPEQAVFANCTMVRQLDFNDSLSGAGHPSDFIPAIFSAGELAGATGADVVRGIHVAYEVFAAVGDAYKSLAVGWDQGTYVALATAMGAGSIFGLNVDQLANAVGIAIVPNMAMMATRHGHLSNWKGSASSHAAAMGFFAARLAGEGMTGPTLAFEGEDGFERHVKPVKELVVGEKIDGKVAILRTSMKYHPAVIHTQALIEPFIEVREQFNVEDVEKIEIATYERAWRMSAGGGGDKEQKWNPTSRETADHSMPYIVARAILDGDITQDTYSDENLNDPRVKALMPKIEVSKRDEFTALYPQQSKAEMKITLRNGEVITTQAGYPVGNVENPMTHEQLSKKFHQMAKDVLDEKKSHEMEAVLWDLHTLKDLNDLAKLYRAI